MDGDATAVALVRSAVSLAHSLGLTMVGEGVESESVLRQLVAFGCDQAQGFHLARPMPADVLERWLRARHGHIGEVEALRA